MRKDYHACMDNDELRRLIGFGAHKERIEEITYVGRKVLETLVSNSKLDLENTPVTQLVRLLLDWIDESTDDKIIKAGALFAPLAARKQEMQLEAFVAVIEAIARQLTDMQRGPFRDWSYIFVYRLGKSASLGGMRH